MDEGQAIVPIKGLKSSYAADFYYEGKDVFIVDSALEKLFRVKTDGTGFTTLISTGLENPQGLALDWIAKNLYIVDARRELIEVMYFVYFTFLIIFQYNYSSYHPFFNHWFTESHRLVIDRKFGAVFISAN